jgi:hypothetical protein
MGLSIEGVVKLMSAPLTDPSLGLYMYRLQQPTPRAQRSVPELPDHQAGDTESEWSNGQYHKPAKHEVIVIDRLERA